MGVPRAEICNFLKILKVKKNKYTILKFKKFKNQIENYKYYDHNAKFSFCQ